MINLGLSISTQKFSMNEDIETCEENINCVKKDYFYVDFVTRRVVVDAKI